MYVENIGVGLVVSLIAPLIFFFISGILVKKHEKCISSFYWVLREKYARSYVNQNAVVRLVRKCFKMELEGTVHWLISLLHLLQAATLLSPLYLLIMLLYLPLKNAIAICIFISLALSAPIVILIEVFTLLQMIRCERIKKKYPEHSTRQLYPWRRNPF